MQQLQRLTHPIRSAGPDVFAIAVYAEALSAHEGAPDRQRAARERGVEGVACVDDAARAIVLFTCQHQKGDEARAVGLLRFLAYMQDEDGAFVNFVLDWTGLQNRTGTTSYPGGPQWQARALHALARAVTTLGPAEWDERYRRALNWLNDAQPYLDVRAICVLAAVEHWRATGFATSGERALAWAEEIASHRRAGRLLNAAGVDTIHLWGHLQEAALVEAGCAFGRSDLVSVARDSADALLLPVAKWFHTAREVLPFDVSCVVAGLRAVARATGDTRYAEAALDARSWFHGNNATGVPVYDRINGLVHDGIDQGRLSRNSGAESNIEGALALLP